MLGWMVQVIGNVPRFGRVIATMVPGENATCVHGLVTISESLQCSRLEEMRRRERGGESGEASMGRPHNLRRNIVRNASGNRPEPVRAPLAGRHKGQWPVLGSHFGMPIRELGSGEGATEGH